ncbi:MAG: hypothetical protein ACKPKO_62355 [Candidatus Fonsibacter sp.]
MTEISDAKNKESILKLQKYYSTLQTTNKSRLEKIETKYTNLTKSYSTQKF